MNNTLSKQLLLASSALTRLALHADQDPKVEKIFDKIEDYLSTVDDKIADTYVMRKFRQLRKEYKTSLIPQIVEYLSKNGLNPQDNAIPVFRDLKQVKELIDNNPTTLRTLAPDKDRTKNAAEVVKFLGMLTSNQSPLRVIVEKLNSMDLRKEADRVQTFIKDAQGISDTVSRVVVNASTSKTSARPGGESTSKVKDMSGYLKSFYSALEKGDKARAKGYIDTYGSLIHRSPSPAKAQAAWKDMQAAFDAKYPGERKKNAADQTSPAAVNVTDPIKAIKWKDMGGNIYVAILNITTKSNKKHLVGLRIDGRGNKNFRVDMKTLGPWEAIDGGDSKAPKTLQAAKTFAVQWVNAVVDQGDLHPRI